MTILFFSHTSFVKYLIYFTRFFRRFYFPINYSVNSFHFLTRDTYKPLLRKVRILIHTFISVLKRITKIPFCSGHIGLTSYIFCLTEVYEVCWLSQRYWSITSPTSCLAKLAPSLQKSNTPKTDDPPLVSLYLVRLTTKSLRSIFVEST